MRLQRFFGGSTTGHQPVRTKYLHRTLWSIRWLFEARPVLNMPCHDKGMPSKAARGYWKLGAIGCRGASWSEQLDDKELRGALVSAIRAERISVCWISSAHASSSASVWYADFKELCKLCCTAVMHKSNTPYSSVFLSRSMRSCILISARSLPCYRSGCCLFSEGCLRELVHLQQLFVRGGTPFAVSVWLGMIVSLIIARSLEYPKVWHELPYRCLPDYIYLVANPPQSSILKYCILVTALSSNLCCRRNLLKRRLLCSVQVIPSFLT